MISELIYKQIIFDTEISAMIATYNNSPAVFYQKSPQDCDRHWEETCCPRINFSIDMRYDPERKSAGTLLIDIWCNSNTPAIKDISPDKDIENRLVEMINGSFYTSSQTTICAVWNRSDAFDLERKSSSDKNSIPEMFGITIIFDLMEFPLQDSSTPDPILGLNNWLKNTFPNVSIISYDKLPEIYKPTDNCPAVYFRFIGYSSSRHQSYAVNWYTGRFAVHIISKTMNSRNNFLKAIMEKLQVLGEIILLDGSPMLINLVSVKHSSDPLRDGQIEISGEYGVLTQFHKENATTKLQNTNFFHKSIL